MTIEEFFEKWNYMCYEGKGCRNCPAWKAEDRGYRSCIDWAVFHYEFIVEYVNNWSK